MTAQADHDAFVAPFHRAAPSASLKMARRRDFGKPQRDEQRAADHGAEQPGDPGQAQRAKNQPPADPTTLDPR